MIRAKATNWKQKRLDRMRKTLAIPVNLPVRRTVDGKYQRLGDVVSSNCSCGSPWSVVFPGAECDVRLCIPCAKAMGWADVPDDAMPLPVIEAKPGPPPGTKTVLPPEFVRQFNSVLAKFSAKMEAESEP